MQNCWWHVHWIAFKNELENHNSQLRHDHIPFDSRDCNRLMPPVIKQTVERRDVLFYLRRTSITASQSCNNEISLHVRYHIYSLHRFMSLIVVRVMTSGIIAQWSFSLVLAWFTLHLTRWPCSLFAKCVYVDIFSTWQVIAHRNTKWERDCRKLAVLNDK